MNLRCIYCQTPFTLARSEMLTAIMQMNDRNMNHYDAHCPRCRRANSISRQRMELFLPNWQEAAKHQPPAAATPHAALMPASAPMKTEPLARGARPVPMSAAKAAVSKPAAKKSSSAAKKAPVKAKAAVKTAPKAKKAPAKVKKKK